MTNPRDPDALLAAYLADGMEVLPQRVIDSVLDEVHRTRRRTVFGPRRTRFMLKPSLAAAALAAAVLALSGLIFAVAGPRPAPSPHPSQPGVVDPSPTAGGPSEGPIPSAVTNPGGVWIPTGTMGTPRYDHTAVRLLDGRVLVLGGSSGSEASGDYADVTSAELYDPLSGLWTVTGSMANPQEGGATLLRDGRVLVGAEIYDPDLGTWSETGRMVNGSGVATLLRDGRVLVTGNDGGEVYDPALGTWTATGAMIAPRHSHAALLLPDGMVLVVGGHAPGDQPTDSAELFDPTTGTWTATANMQRPRELINGFVQPDGKVLVLGSSRGDPLSVELYDPSSGTWTATGGLSTPGTSQEFATLLQDGRILLTGFDNTAELYDPVAGSWSAAAPMLRPHTPPAILLLDGTVLIAGGRDCLDSVCVATGSAELYVPAGVASPPLPAFPTPPPPVFPSPTPRPSPYPPASGPVPPNARQWTVTVVNDSSQPTTLFLAEDGEDGIGQLCGSVTPNVVPAVTTMDVTFQLPPKPVTSCWIWVNPVPGEGGSLFQTSDAPMPGRVFVTADGQTGWLGQ